MIRAPWGKQTHLDVIFILRLQLNVGVFRFHETIRQLFSCRNSATASKFLGCCCPNTIKSSFDNFRNFISGFIFLVQYNSCRNQPPVIRPRVSCERLTEIILSLDSANICKSVLNF
jgi:hypothetical protein